MAEQKRAIAQRTQEILEDLLLAGKVSVNDLAAQLEVSPTTVRRSLRHLEKQGLLRRSHGGAVSVETALYEPFRYDADFQEREQVYAEEKRRIGLAAAELVPDGATVAISAGTTTTQVARALKLRREVTIITNAVNIAMELAKTSGLKVLLTGGIVSGTWFSVLGPATLAAIAQVQVDVAFIGVDGLDLQAGVTAAHAEEAKVNAAMLAQAQRKIVVLDHSKLGQQAAFPICPLSGLDLILTDFGANDAAVAPFLARGLDLRRV